MIGLWHNSMFTRISKANVRRYAIHRLRIASLFGQNIVIDLSFEDQMSRSVCESIANQINNCCAINRYQFAEPFNLYICNIDYDSIFWQILESKLTKIKVLNFFVNFTHKSYLDLFEDKSKLVYLSPKADKYLNYDQNKVYIIAGDYNKSQTQPMGSVKALQQNIELQRLPFDKYVLWNIGSKSLRLNQVLNILNDVKDGKEWPEAIRDNLPANRIKTPEMIANEELIKLEKIKNRFAINKFNSSKIDVKELFQN